MSEAPPPPPPEGGSLDFDIMAPPGTPELQRYAVKYGIEPRLDKLGEMLEKAASNGDWETCINLVQLALSNARSGYQLLFPVPLDAKIEKVIVLKAAKRISSELAMPKEGKEQLKKLGVKGVENLKGPLLDTTPEIASETWCVLFLIKQMVYGLPEYPDRPLWFRTYIGWALHWSSKLKAWICEPLSPLTLESLRYMLEKKRVLPEHEEEEAAAEHEEQSGGLEPVIPEEPA